MGSGSPERVASILRMHNAALPRQEKSLVMASSHKSLKFVEAAANLRTLFGSRGAGSRQGVLVAEKAGGPLASERGQEVYATREKLKKHGAGQNRKEGFLKRGRDKARGGGQALSGLNRRTRLRNRGNRCDSEYHLPPKRPRQGTPHGDRSPPPHGAW